MLKSLSKGRDRYPLRTNTDQWGKQKINPDMKTKGLIKSFSTNEKPVLKLEHTKLSTMQAKLSTTRVDLIMNLEHISGQTISNCQI